MNVAARRARLYRSGAILGVRSAISGDPDVAAADAAHDDGVELLPADGDGDHDLLRPGIVTAATRVAGRTVRGHRDLDPLAAVIPQPAITGCRRREVAGGAP